MGAIEFILFLPRFGLFLHFLAWFIMEIISQNRFTILLREKDEIFEETYMEKCTSLDTRIPVKKGLPNTWCSCVVYLILPTLSFFADFSYLRIGTTEPIIILILLNCITIFFTYLIIFLLYKSTTYNKYDFRNCRNCCD